MSLYHCKGRIFECSIGRTHLLLHQQHAEICTAAQLRGDKVLDVRVATIWLRQYGTSPHWPSCRDIDDTIQQLNMCWRSLCSRCKVDLSTIHMYRFQMLGYSRLSLACIKERWARISRQDSCATAASDVRPEGSRSCLLRRSLE